MSLKEELANRVMDHPKLKSYAKRLAGNNWEDCLQELLLVVAEKTDKELKTIQPYFDFWCVRTVRNMNGKRGTMAKYRKAYVDMIELDLASADFVKRVSAEQVEDDLNKLTWYERELFKCYIEEGNLRAVTAATSIPLSSIWATIKDVKFKLKWAQSR
tara:strand:+ start:1174 stop:1647 length:474 start_codon:yes stop_codon:yes gene_type:complete